MVREICLDSDVIIDLSKNVDQIKSRLISLDALFYITSINVFEVWFGRKEKDNALEFLEKFGVLDLNKSSALLAADILRDLKKEGLILDFRDIFVASICITNKIELMTNNLKHFERFKKFGLRLVSL